MLQEVISGGRTGVELSALETARANGVVTGGFMPPGNNEARLLRDFGLRRTIAANQESHMRINAHVADGVLLFTRWPNRHDGLRQLAAEKEKPMLEVVPDAGQALTSQGMTNWIREHNIKVLYATGDDDQGGLCDYVASTLNEFFENLKCNNEIAVGENHHDIHPSWIGRPTRQRRRQGSASSLASFLNDPTSDNATLLWKNSYSYIWAALESAWQLPNNIPPAEIPENVFNLALQIRNSQFESLKDLCGKSFGFKELTEDFAFGRQNEWEQQGERFEKYVIARTYFEILRLDTRLHGDEFRRRVADLFVCCFSSELFSFLRQKHRGLNCSPDRRQAIVETAVYMLLDENKTYITGQNLPNRFRQFVHGLQKRANDWKLPDAIVAEANNPNAFSYLKKAESKMLFRNEENGGLDNLRGEIDWKYACLLDSYYGSACRAAAMFENVEGRRLFLWLVLGGMSHTKDGRGRQDETTTQYLVQPTLQDWFLQQDPNFRDRWYAQPVNELMEDLDFHAQAVGALCRETVERRQADNEYVDDLDVEIEECRKIILLKFCRPVGWKAFNEHLSDHVFKMIRENQLTPEEGRVDDEWVNTTATFGDEFEPATVNQRRGMLATFTKQVCDLAGRAEGGWTTCFKQFGDLGHKGSCDD